MNLEAPIFQNKEFRIALQYLFNFERLNRNLMYNEYFRLKSFFEGTEFANPNLQSYEFSSEKAREHLEPMQRRLLRVELDAVHVAALDDRREPLAVLGRAYDVGRLSGVCHQRVHVVEGAARRRESLRQRCRSFEPDVVPADVRYAQAGRIERPHLSRNQPETGRVPEFV